MTDAKGRNKANKAEMALRVEGVRRLLLQGYPTQEILRLTSEEWGQPNAAKANKSEQNGVLSGTKLVLLFVLLPLVAVYCGF